MKYLMVKRQLESIQNETSFHSDLVKTTFRHQIFHSGSFWISQKRRAVNLTISFSAILSHSGKSQIDVSPFRLIATIQNRSFPD